MSLGRHAEQTLLALKIGFLVLLYLFIWARRPLGDARALRSAPAGEHRAQRRRPRPRALRAAVAPPSRTRRRARQPGARRPGTDVPSSRRPTRVGRGAENAIRLDGDDSSRPATRSSTPAPTASGSRTSGSTNGTFVNGARVTTARLLAARRRRPDRPDRPRGGGLSVRLGRAVGITDTGRRRPQNEDAFVCEPPLFAVADGIGGAQAGEIASRLAAAAIEERAAQASGEETLVALVREANDRIFERALAGPGRGGDGHDGDRRARRRGGRHDRDRPRRRLARLPLPRRRARAADDRPLARRRARPLGPADRGRGGRPPAPLGDHARRRHRAGGRGRHDRRSTPRPATCYCSAPTGSPRWCATTSIAGVVEAHGRRSPARAARSSSRAANDAGGDDNVTVVLFEIVEGDPVPRQPAEADRRATARARGTLELERHRGGRPAPRRGQGEPLARPAARPRPAGRDGRSSSGGASSGERAEPRAPHPRPRRSRRLRGVRERLDRGRGADRPGLARRTRRSSSASSSSAHVVARVIVPDADPTLLPLAALLCAIGLTVIYRIDAEDGRRQLVWVGDRRPRVRARARLAPLRLPRARALQVRLRRLGDRAADAARPCRGSAPGQRRQALGQGRPAAVPARRAREDLPDHLPRRATCATSARRSPAAG